MGMKEILKKQIKYLEKYQNENDLNVNEACEVARTIAYIISLVQERENSYGNDNRTLLEDKLDETGAQEDINLSKREKVTMSVNEAALYAGMAHERLREQIHKKDTDLPFFYVGARVAINKKQFDNWLDKISQEHRNL